MCLPAVVLAGMCTCLLKRTDQRSFSRKLNSPSLGISTHSSSFLLASPHTMTDEQATVKRAARLLRARELVAQGHFRACETTELQIISENDTSKGNTLTPASGPEFPGRGRGNNWKARGGSSSRGSENRNRTSLPRIPRPHTSEQPVRSRQQVSVGSVAASRKVWQPKSARALDMVSSASKGPISAEVDVPVMDRVK